ncbi:MAG: outer membrane beta-barrel protein, partial [Ignavibacteria bacterium]
AMPVGRGPRGRSGRNQNPLLNIEIPISEGNNDIYAFGINYSNIFAEKLEVNGSYFYNHLKNTNNTKSNRKYLSDLKGLDRYNETIYSVGKSFNHRFNSFIDYKPDTMNIFRLRPDIQFFTNNNFTTSITENYLINQTLLNSVDFKRNNKTENFDLNNDFVYSYRFPKPGRTFSIGLNTSFSKRLSDYDLFSKNSSFVDSSLITDTLNQVSDYVNKKFSQTVNLSFTERAGENSLIRLRFNPQMMIENRSRDTYKSDSLSSNSLIFDSLYSSSFTNQNLAIRGSASYRYNVENFSLEIDLMYQYHLRKGIQKFPRNFETKNRFNAILPSLEIRYQISDFQRLRIEYNTRVQIPSVSQLQNTIDFSNPNFLRTGNPNLDKVLINRFNIRYFVTNPEEGRFNSYSMNVAYTIDNISNNVIVFTRDTTLERNIFVSRGTQLSYPVNVGNSLNVLFNSLNSFRISVIKSNLSFSTSFRYTRTPNLISGKENITYQYGIGENIALSSGNPQLDYRLNYSPDFTYSINSLNRKISRIFIQRFNASIRANVWNEFYLGSKLTFYKNSSLTASNNSSLIWNIALSYLFLTNKSAELKLEVIDILNQKKKLERIIREDYFEDRITNQLERFIILSFSYNLRAFK